jgi:transposase
VCGWRKRGQQNQELGRSTGGFSCKIFVSVDGLGNAVEFLLTPGQAGDSPRLPKLVEGRNPNAVLGDNGFDSNNNLECIAQEGAEAVIPPKTNRTHPQECDYALYKERHQVECYIGKPKYFRRIFSRFDKYAAHFLDFIHYAATLQ